MVIEAEGDVTATDISSFTTSKIRVSAYPENAAKKGLHVRHRTGFFPQELEINQPKPVKYGSPYDVVSAEYL